MLNNTIKYVQEQIKEEKPTTPKEEFPLGNGCRECPMIDLCVEDKEK